jgi:hypothetical protein
MVFVLSSRPVMSRFRRGVRRGKDGETNVCDANQTRQLAPAIAGRWLGKNGPSGTDLVASLLAGANARYHSRSPFDFSFPNFRFQHFPQGVTEPTLALVPRAKYRHASAAPLAGLITFRPLHSISLQFRKLHFRSIRSDGRKLPRPSETAVRPKIPEAARLRPAKKSAIARDASHGQDIGITARGSACRRGRGNNREIGHFCTASISQAALQRTETAELTGKTRLV